MSRYKRKLVKDLAIAILLTLFLYLISVSFWDKLLPLLSKLPFFNELYLIGKQEIERKSIIGLSIITFTGSLFFIGYPAELFFLIYAKIGYNLLHISFTMLFYIMIAQAINYGFGYFIEKKFLHLFLKDEKKFLRSVKKYDAFFIIIINILPLPADILSVLLGMIKYDFQKAMVYTTIGKILKFIFLILLILIARQINSKLLFLF